MNKTNAKLLLDMFKDHQIGSFDTLDKKKLLAEIMQAVIQDDEVLRLTGATDRAVDTIKIIRALTNCSLFDAKTLYDKWNPTRTPNVAIEVPIVDGKEAAIAMMQQFQMKGYSYSPSIFIE